MAGGSSVWLPGKSGASDNWSCTYLMCCFVVFLWLAGGKWLAEQIRWYICQVPWWQHDDCYVCSFRGACLLSSRTTRLCLQISRISGLLLLSTWLVLRSRHSVRAVLFVTTGQQIAFLQPFP